MNFIIIFLIGAFIGAELSYHFKYSEKADVKRFWRQINKIQKRKEEYGKINNDNDKDFDLMIEKRKKMINFFLDNFFDPEKDKEFLDQHKT